MRGKIEIYCLLICAVGGVGMAFIAYLKTYNYFKRAKIKETSLLRKVPIIRKLVEKEPYYARIIPIIFSFAILLLILIVYVCFWINPISLYEFLSNKYTIIVGAAYVLGFGLYAVSI